jgi:hypothetical protein
MLTALKKFLKGDDRPEVVKMFEKAKDERQALVLLKESRGRDESRRANANQHINSLVLLEKRLMEQGQEENATDSEKMHLVRQIKALREEMRDLQAKVDKIYTPRLRTVCQHIASLETVIEVKSEPIPSIEALENTAVKARTMMGDLDQAVELAHGISTPFMKEGPDKEEEAIMAEMQERADKVKEKKIREKEEKEDKEIMSISKAKAKTKMAKKALEVEDEE